MSAHPDAPAPVNKYSNVWNVPLTPIYETMGGTQPAELAANPGVANDNYIQDRHTVPPYQKKLENAVDHPCYTLNKELGQCAKSQPHHFDLASRSSRCNSERLALMKCFSYQKRREIMKNDGVK